MAGNSQRKGAIRKSSKGPTAGSGGRVKRGLEGKGPTPKAQDRPYHKAYKAKQRAEKSAATRPRRRTSGDVEWIAGRNPVVEALREGVPVTGVYVAEGAERDALFARLLAERYEHGAALNMATTLEIDAVIDPAETRAWLARGLASARLRPATGSRFVDTW